MALLQLKDIGKIYVSEGNVAVGIRGVNLSFDKGEFVAVTGQSGSGKSTLLNVISGIDTYEEGELLIEGEPTSHFLQPEWEDYRQKYISFIFQDYNIIESFTVLQNVELALMHIENKKERRRRALTLLDRVGMTSHLHHKGSRLSGGQKQRTVIARALAKDSPIILADEPTGNLDSATSAEIIELLREVSRDKLLIMVTHNFEQVEHCATRHVRVYDGAIESDAALRPAETVQEPAQVSAPDICPEKAAKKHYVRKGMTLGRSLFTSRPKLSVFLCLLLIIGALGIFLITGYCGSASLLFEEYTMFTPSDGRVVLTRQDGSPISDDTLSDLASRYGAKDSLRYDSFLDSKNNYAYLVGAPQGDDFQFDVVYDQTFDAVSSVGRYPQKPGEVYLYLPISKQPIYGDTTLIPSTVCLNNDPLNMQIVGVGYYYDNNLTPKVVFTKEGFAQATAMDALFANTDMQWNLSIQGEKTVLNQSGERIGVWNELPGDAVYVNLKAMGNNAKPDGTETVTLTLTARSYGGYGSYGYYGGGGLDSSSYSVPAEQILLEAPQGLQADGNYEIYVSPQFLIKLYREMNQEYSQASLFFENDKVAQSKLAALRAEGYVAVLSDAEYEPDVGETLGNFMLGALMALVWVVAIVFLAFFINLCTNRTLAAFKGDMAIMRSMGIPVGAIRVGMYVRMLIALIPAYLSVIAAGLIVFRIPSLNAFFKYLYPWQYILIFAGLLLLTFRITRGQIRRLFRESVKKSLRGGNAE